MDFSKQLFRASAIGQIMTNDRSGKAMGETAKKYLLDIYVKEVYGRDKELINKYIVKGLECEESSMTLYCRNVKTFYKKNEQRFENDFISGTPDIITEDKKIIDIKSSWSIHTFFDVFTKKINPMYMYQLQSYMALTGCFEAKLVYCLVSTPLPLIHDEIKKLQWKMGVVDPENNKVFKQAADYLETSMQYEDIDLKDRFIEFTIERDDNIIQSIYKRVNECRSFLNDIGKVKEISQAD